MYTHILIPIAFDHEADTRRALEIAGRLLDGDGAVTCLHVLERFPEYVEAQLSPEVLERSRAEARKMLDTAAGGHDLKVRPELTYGHAGRGILEFAEQADVDCIIIASHDPGFQDYLLGSTAAQVVRHAHCAVHVLR